MSVLSVRGLTKRYGATAALDAVDLDVAAGELVAVVGPSGCGKSTLLRLIAGLVAPDAGQVSVAGEVVAGSGGRSLPPEARRVGLVFQDHALFPHLDVTANVAFGLGALRRPERAARVTEALALVRMEHLARRYPHELSGGEQQRVALARALAPRPVALLLDEPFSGLDPELRAGLRDDVVALLRELGTTTLLVTHDRAEALADGDRVAVLRDGRLEQVDPPEVAYRAPATPFVATFLGPGAWIPGDAGGGEVDTELGRRPVLGDPTGPVEALARPEDVRVGEGPVRARVEGRGRFVGAGWELQLRLPSGVVVTAVSPRPAAPRTDVAVGWAATTPVVARPTPSDPGTGGRPTQGWTPSSSTRA